MLIEVKICGIPATVRLTRYRRHRGRFSNSCVSPDDYFGWTDIEFTICDRRGNRAVWLENKMNKTDFEVVKEQIHAHMREEEGEV